MDDLRTGRVETHGLDVDPTLHAFVEHEALPGSGVSSEAFWSGLAALIRDLGPRNAELLAIREGMQARIDAWHCEHPDRDPAAYRAFLEGIGYLVPEGPDFRVETEALDPEIATVAAPQLVVPATNARYAINAANARWGSLFDALYGTDALGGPPQEEGYDAERGRRVIERAKAFLDEAVPLFSGSWADVVGLRLRPDGLRAVILNGQDWRQANTTVWAEPGLQEPVPVGMEVPLADPAAFEGTADRDGARAVLLRHHGLGIELVLDRGGRIGRDDPLALDDLRLEAAVTAIVDCEDSVACVDGPDKALAYRNWLGLMTGDLTDEVSKGGRTFTRRLEADRAYASPDGRPFEVRRCALLLVRNVGHLMTTPAVSVDGREAPEGLVDAMVTVLCACHDLRGARRNSPAGSAYVVKPKMHGPDEVAFAVETMERVEDALGLPRDTVKLGIMDEERRTSANLKACIRAARRRVAFINTGFLDRTGDEIHTSMEAGPMVPKGEMKETAWIAAYEERNVDVGLACGLGGRGQIGKGMWAMPDLMADMLAEKGAHPEAGASTAWVPSPTAATLHALHYHRVDVAARQRAIAEGGPRRGLADLLDDPADGPGARALRGRGDARGREQRPRDPRLRGALGRSGGGLLQGARQGRRGPDGGPRDLPDLVPGSGQLAPSRRGVRGAPDGRPARGWPRWSIARTRASPATARWRRASTVRPSARRGISCS